jgi:uncharacterized protein (DUF885 family)
MPSHPPSPDPSADTFAALEKETLELLWRHNPVQASLLGQEEYDSLLPSIDADSRVDFCWCASRLLERLRRLPQPSEGDAAGRAAHWALRSVLLVPKTLEEQFSPFTRNPVLCLENLLHGIYLLFQRPGKLDEHRAAAIGARLREVPRVLREGRTSLQPHATRVPKGWAEAALRLVEGGQALIRQAQQALQNDVPALAGDAERDATAALQHVADYAGFIRSEILPRARGSHALGRDLFHFLLEEEHHLPYRDVDLEAWARHEIHETRRELDRLASEIGSGLDWRACLEELKQEHPPAEGLVGAYRREVERARRFVSERGLATLPSGEELVVAETPEFERWAVPFAAYLPPPPFGASRRGTFWVTPPGRDMDENARRDVLRDHCNTRIPITTLHETYPGHHLQLLRLCEVKSPICRQYTTSVFIEGWALYCEEMMIEQGFVEGPRSRLFQVRDHLWRACRVLLDVGLHTGSLGLEEAARVLVDEACLQPQSAAAEVARYTQNPTQPLSYLIGKREIQALRREVERSQGHRFRLRDFHDRFLSHGSLPIRFLRDLLAVTPEPVPEPATTP